MEQCKARKAMFELGRTAVRLLNESAPCPTLEGAFLDGFLVALRHLKAPCEVTRELEINYSDGAAIEALFYDPSAYQEE